VDPDPEPLLRAEGFSCGLDDLNEFFFNCNFFSQFLVIKGLDPDPYPEPDWFSDKMLDPDPESMNPDTLHCRSGQNYTYQKRKR
jgi:hypothetical protein